MSEQYEHACYWAIRAKNNKGGARWLYAAIFGRYASPHYQHDKFHSCDKELSERPEWRFSLSGLGPTWFKSLTAAKRRLRAKVVKQHQRNGFTIEIVRVRLVAHEDVAYTSAEDAVSKLGALSGTE